MHFTPALVYSLIFPVSTDKILMGVQFWSDEIGGSVRRHWKLIDQFLEVGLQMSVFIHEYLVLILYFQDSVLQLFILL